MTIDYNLDFASFLDDVRERSSVPSLDLATARDVFESIHLAAKEPEGVGYAEVDAGGVEALWCIPVDSHPDAVLLHGHMGGGVLGSMHSDRKAAAHIAKATGVRALVLNYRRAPEHKFPAQIDDVEKAYLWLLKQGHRAERVATVGNSIGGYLAVSLAVRLRDKGAALPGAILAISPSCDPTLSRGSISGNADADRLLSRPLLEFFRSAWLDGTGIDFNDPRVNLLEADLSGLPPLAVFYGEQELFASEAFEFAIRAQEAGTHTMIRPVPAGQHSFIMGAGRVPEVDDAIRAMGYWLRSRLGLEIP
jgi:monoterpene epsilon-lactone hydrolase